MEHPREAEGRRPCLPLVGVRRQHPEEDTPKGAVAGKLHFFRKKIIFQSSKIKFNSCVCLILFTFAHYFKLKGCLHHVL